MAKISIIGSITQIVFKHGKKTAQVSLTIPVDKVNKIPTGEVNLTIESTQAEMFGKK